MGTFEMILESMGWYNEGRSKWIEIFGNSEEFDAWFAKGTKKRSKKKGASISEGNDERCCVDCKFYVLDPTIVRDPHMCRYEFGKSLSYRDIITGERKEFTMPVRECSTLRGSCCPNACRLDGKWWETKE
mgnify:CR=1 FL=1